MTKSSQSLTQPLHALLAQPDKRRAAIVVLLALNVTFAIWLGMNVHRSAKTHQDTLGLMQANQSTLDALDVEQDEQRNLEETIKKRLANRDDLNSMILALESTAPAHGVTLSDANQTFVEASRDKLPHSLIQYSVQGSYSGVLQFVAESLNKHEALVLKSLTFRRSDPLVSNMQINLEWALYYR
ncbi:MAG: hypothetical protein CMN90_12690 [Sutterellaceae bacterium]|nr:hypothetical protein [Limnobacter sp. UBA3528]MAZ10518.1 hypothetical protein [Sutterellaceae bacterium]|tara:strand:- start:3809 stop:4360 length:552 start_codon:yes stop_codon:yes gene_type:complete